MLMGIVSDTHDSVTNTLKAFKFFNKKGVSLVLHCGDWVAPFMLDATKELDCPVKSVFGNNEGDSLPYYNKIKNDELNIEISSEGVWEGEFDGKKIAITHGHQPVILNLLLNAGYDLVASGHTHEAAIRKHDETLHVNPGAILGAKLLEVKDKFSFAIYDTITGKAQIYEL
ncbi:MAG: metallophosphoesterase [Candidatus Nanoarchaeia archaeon]